MNKCISCGAEVPPQTRFCGTCGAMQPDETNANEIDNVETVLSNPSGENTPPPPPPTIQAQQDDETKNRDAEMPQPGSGEQEPLNNSSMGQSGNPPSGPQPQTPTSYDDSQQPQQPQHLQQPYSGYQQPQTPYGDYQQPSSPYGNYQQPQAPYYQQPSSPYGNYQQPQVPYGSYPPPQPSYSSPQLPPLQSGSYQQVSNMGPQITNAAASAATTPNIGMGIMGPPPATMGGQQKPPPWRLWVIIGVVAAVIVASLGTGLYFLLKPRPDITVTSDYHDSGTPAGAIDTPFHVRGEKFAPNSTITFLLGSKTVDTQTQSDANGNLSADLKVTSNWPAGRNTLTAHDANNNTTNTGQTISIVQQGFNGTPGPNGAPTNTANFKINVEVQMSGSNPLAGNFELDVKGQTDSQGGTVCAPGDDGSQQNNSYTSNGTTITDTSTYTCIGTYKGGQVKYDETLDTREYTDSTGGRCRLNSQQPSYAQIVGTYTTSNQFSGTVTLSSLADNQFTCTGDLTGGGFSGASGTWTGTVSNT